LSFSSNNRSEKEVYKGDEESPKKMSDFVFQKRPEEISEGEGLFEGDEESPKKMSDFVFQKRPEEISKVVEKEIEISEGNKKSSDDSLLLNETDFDFD